MHRGQQAHHPSRRHDSIWLLILLLLTPLYAAPPEHMAPLPATDATHRNILNIGTKIFPPFVMKTSANETAMMDDQANTIWQGISIELWEEIARRLNSDFQWQQQSLQALLDNTTNASLDAAIAAITITAEREHKLDFSHSYYTTGLSIAIPRIQDNGWQTILNGIFSRKMLMLVLALTAVLFVIGTLTWLIERHKNPQTFHPDPIRGIAGGIWWAAVTMTTVGYGDMTPKTLGGRLLALFWMFASLLLVSAIIASVASTLTLSKIEPLVSGPDDLAKARIASIKHSTSDTYLKKRHLNVRYFATVNDCLRALDSGKVDAVVYDRPLLSYLIKQHYADTLQMTDSVFEQQHYGIAFPPDSPLREPVNRIMLQILESPKWQKILNKYLGDS